MLISHGSLSEYTISDGPRNISIQKALTINWAMLNLVQKLNFRFKWQITNTVTSATKTFVWSILRKFENVYTFIWDVERDVVSIRGCRNYTYPCTDRIAECPTECPSPTTKLSSNLTFKWELLPYDIVDASLTLNWDQSLNLITETSPIIFNWDLGIQPCSAQLIENYAVWGSTTKITTTYLNDLYMSSDLEWTYVARALSSYNLGYVQTLAPGEVCTGGLDSARVLSWQDVQRVSDVSMDDSYAIFVDAAGGRCFVAARDSALSVSLQDQLVEYSLPSPNKYRISTPGAVGSGSAIYQKKVSYGPIYSSTDNFNRLLFKPDGLRMYGMEGTNIHQFSLSEAWNIDTLSYDGVVGIIGISFYIDPTGTCLYCWRTSNKTLYQYNLPNSWDVLGVTFSDVISTLPISIGYMEGLFVTKDRIIFLEDLNADPAYRIWQYNYPGTDYVP